MRVTCSMQGEKVQMRTVSVGERALGESAPMEQDGGEGVVDGCGVAAETGAGESVGVGLVEVGNEGVGRALRVKCGRASLELC